VQPAVTLQFGGDVTIDAFSFGPGEGGAPARLRAELDAGALGRAVLEGTVAARLGEETELDLELDLDVTQLDSGAVAPYLTAAGVNVRVEPIDIALGLRAELRVDEQGLALEAALESLSVTHADGVLASLDALRVSGVRAGADGVRVPKIALELEGLALRASRLSEGEFFLAGVRVGPVQEEENGQVDAPAVPDVPAVPPPTSTGPDSEEPSRLAHLLTAPLGIERIGFRDVRLAWEDLVPDPPLATNLALDGSVRCASDDPDARSVGLDLELAFDSGNVSLKAVVEVAADTASISAELAGDRLDTRVAARYFPQLPVLEHGRIRATIEAGLEREGAGFRARAELRDLELRDVQGDVERDALIALEGLRIALLQPDAELQEFTIEEVVLEEFELDVRRGVAGIVVAGFGVGGDGSRTGRVLKESVRETLVPRSFRIDDETTPTVRLQTLDMHFARITFLDEVGPGAEPVTARGRLTALPGVLLETEVDDLAPLTLELAAHVEPIVRDLELTVRAQPFATSPEIDVELLLQGLSGGGLAAVLPALVATVDARAIEDGELAGHANVVLEFGRRGPLDFDLSSGVGGELLLTDLALRDAEGEVLAGLTSLELDVEELSLARGTVNAQSLVLLDPVGSLRVREDALEFAGIVLREAAPVEPEAGVAPEGVIAEASAPELPRRERRPSPRLRLDRLGVSGIDFTLIDERSQPPVTLPLDDLALDVRGLHIPFAPNVPVRVHAYVSLGDVELCERKEGSGVTGFMGGVLGSARAVVPGTKKGKGPPTVLRPLGQLDVEASLVFEPALVGRVRGEVQSLELGFLRQRAKASGVEIRDGLLDATLDLRFREEGLSARTRSTWTSLDVSEAEDGPVGKFLKLPAPLNAVIFLLRNRHGQIQLNFDFDLPPGGMSRRAVTTKATAAISQVTARAIASSPLRVTSAATDVLIMGTETVDDVLGMTGLGRLSPFKKKSKTPEVETLAVSYHAGALLMSAVESRALIDFLERWEKTDGLLTVRHELGRGDLERAAILANPGEAECRALITRFEGQRGELMALRTESSSAAIDHFAAGRAEEGERSAELLLAIDRELGFSEDALDELYALLRPGAQRLAGRRTRTAALSLAARRLEAFEAVIDLRFPKARSRVRILRPRFGKDLGDGGGSVQLVTRPQ